MVCLLMNSGLNDTEQYQLSINNVEYQVDRQNPGTCLPATDHLSANNTYI